MTQLSCHYYWFFEPISSGEYIDPGKDYAADIPVKHLGHSYQVALHCRQDGAPMFLKVVIPNLSEERIPDHAFPFFNIAKEHTLTVLRLTYRSDVQLFPMDVWMFSPDDKAGLNIEIHVPQPDLKLDQKKADSVFRATINSRENLRLLADGINEFVPKPYRFLSLFKILENKFRAKGQWRTEALGEFLSSYEQRFDEAFPGRKPIRVVHELRDRCAHVETIRGERGVTHLNHAQTVKVERALPILRDACRDLLNLEGEGLFVLGDLRPWWERADGAIQPDDLTESAE